VRIKKRKRRVLMENKADLGMNNKGFK